MQDLVILPWCFFCASPYCVCLLKVSESLAFHPLRHAECESCLYMQGLIRAESLWGENNIAALLSCWLRHVCVPEVVSDVSYVLHSLLYGRGGKKKTASLVLIVSIKESLKSQQWLSLSVEMPFVQLGDPLAKVHADFLTLMKQCGTKVDLTSFDSGHKKTIYCSEIQLAADLKGPLEGGGGGGG